MIKVTGVPREQSAGATVLLVEDEESLRSVMSETLASFGCTVLEAQNAAHALALAENHDGPIHVLLTDVVMPDLGGAELAERMRQHRPDTRVLYMSGYTDDAVIRHGVLAGETAYIQKPFTLEALAEKLSAVLGADPASGSSSGR